MLYPRNTLEPASIKELQPSLKQYKVAAGGGLYLLVMPTGAMYWRLKYRFNGKEKLLSLGIYPEVGIDEARAKRDDARELLINGIDPSELAQKAREADRNERMRVKAANRFTLGDDGALQLQLGRRSLTLTPKETHDLCNFLQALPAASGE
ncbi:MAG: integrase arm-type DNA-binding domain-containing protein [Betaproteobacteria bacterium]|nr:integrase arm-type DNA-binding domain-containing protein [Betaproteobacteria bacterium]MDE1980902.1 DUF4102 domain-containing protein [Betaproteobacteria bacterium]